MEEDTEIIAGQLAELTRTVERMAAQLKALRERADNERERADKQQERSEVQQERIDLAARELAEVSDRLQAAANALRESISRTQRRPASGPPLLRASTRLLRVDELLLDNLVRDHLSAGDLRRIREHCVELLIAHPGC